MNSKILDLDDPSTYAGIFDEILYADDIWPILKEDFNGQQEIFNQNPENIINPDIKNLRYKCNEVFKKNYICVMAYHACRTNNPEQYRQFGLLTALPERLEPKAREIFAGKEGLEKAISKEKSYFDAHGGQIHMYISAKFAAIEYLDKGSMYFRRVGYNIGGDFKGQGKPVFVKCKLPLSWLQFFSSYWGKQRFLYRYVVALMSECILVKINPDNKHMYFNETLAVSKDIPSKNVLAILPAEVCINWIKRG
ncbi:MAG: hypothetical protein K9L76_00110 [Candidatus Omnitrophica bacterium]|nr:hypothetical protein [Candidatus Omnitrophota bacterium]